MHERGVDDAQLNPRPAFGRTALRIRGRDFVWGERTYVMGIVNVSPDSFSGDATPGADDARARALAQLQDGADMLDIGAESTRPGAKPVDAATERERLIPALRAIRAAAPEAVLSLDTFKAGVLRAGLDAGGDVLNSVRGLDDEHLAREAAERAVPVIVMHNKAVAKYDGDVVDEVIAWLSRAAEGAVRAGIAPERVILDPGIGFGKTPEHNLAILGSLGRIVGLGFPTLIGTSRKATIGKLTGRAVAERQYGTAATVALAVAAKIDIVRVHDVAAACDVVRVSDAVVRGWRPADWAATVPLR